MKKFLCMMMAVLMVLAMAACGGEPANNGGNDTPDATTVKIGGIGPLTGAYANYGLSEKNGAELAVWPSEQPESCGWYHGRKTR